MAESEQRLKKPKCELLEMFQYHCYHKWVRGEEVISCKPIERVFRKCQGRPMVEVTHVVQVDPKSDKYYLPAHLEDAMPPAYHWHELR